MFKLALKSLISRKKIVLLVYISLSLSVLLFLAVQRSSQISRDSFSRTISGTDLIVGSRTGSLNLLLYSVFHMGNAVNNIGYEEYLSLAEREEVEWAVPISLGDSHRGYRVVGTNRLYFDAFQYGAHQNLELASGELNFDSPFDAVIGANVARDLGYKPGDEIILSHGVGHFTLQRHDNMPFEVQAVLKQTGTAVDNGVYVPLEGITAIHVGWETGMQTRTVRAEQVMTRDLRPDSITAVYLGLKQRTAAISMQRDINNSEGEPLTAIMPGAALYELWRIMGSAETIMTGIAAFVVLIGLVSLLTSELAVLEQRRREMALFRSIGATAKDLFRILFYESLIVTAAGCISGVLLLYGLQGVLQPVFRSHGLYAPWTLPSLIEWALLGVTMAAGILGGLVPAAAAYRRSLSDGMTIRS